MRNLGKARIPRSVPAVVLATLVLLFLCSASAHALPAYFAGQGGCVSAACHPASPSTCNGCHAHGVHSGAAKNNLNLTAQTNQADYAPGAAVTVTLNGGYQSGWIRANLYDNTGTLVDTSTGPSGLGGGAGFPVQLTAPAPATPGTYTFTAAWYGNQYDLSQVGGTTFFGPRWTPDATNPGHGEEKISTNSFTVTAAPDTTPPTVLSTVPANNATNVAVNTAVAATFSEPLDPATVDNTSFFVSNGVDNVAGTVTFAGNIATFTPAAPLTDNTAYTATITTAVMDLAGNPLAANLVWTFTTAAAAPPAPAGGGDSGFFGCAVVAPREGSSGLPGAYALLVLAGLGAALRRRMKRNRR